MQKPFFVVHLETFVNCEAGLLKSVFCRVRINLNRKIAAHASRGDSSNALLSEGGVRKDYMTVNSKQRSFLIGLASKEDALFQVGKAGITPEVCEAVSDALETHELVKIKLLKNCFDDVREAGETLAGRTRSELVKVIGRTAILYRPSKDHKRIELP